MELAIKELRKKLHISQSEFADAVGVSMRTVGSWERGESFPNAEQVWNCAIALGCSPNEILCWDEKQESGKLTDDEREIVDNYRESSPQWQQNIAMTAKAAASDSRKE